MQHGAWPAILRLGDLLMCLAAPAQVVSISDNTAIVDYKGVRTTARLDTLTEAVAVGDYVLIHTGFAIRRLSPSDGVETLRLFDELAKSLLNPDRAAASESTLPLDDDAAAEGS